MNRCNDSGAIGLISVNAFDGHTWQFQVNHPTSSGLIQQEFQIPKELVSMPFKRDGAGFVYMPVTIAGKEVYGLFDTGTSADGLMSPEE